MIIKKLLLKNPDFFFLSSSDCINRGYSTVALFCPQLFFSHSFLCPCALSQRSVCWQKSLSRWRLTFPLTVTGDKAVVWQQCGRAKQDYLSKCATQFGNYLVFVTSLHLGNHSDSFYHKWSIFIKVLISSFVFVLYHHTLFRVIFITERPCKL